MADYHCKHNQSLKNDNHNRDEKIETIGESGSEANNGVGNGREGRCATKKEVLNCALKNWFTTQIGVNDSNDWHRVSAERQ